MGKWNNKTKSTVFIIMIVLLSISGYLLYLFKKVVEGEIV